MTHKEKQIMLAKEVLGQIKEVVVETGEGLDWYLQAEKKVQNMGYDWLLVDLKQGVEDVKKYLRWTQEDAMKQQA